MVAPNLSRDSTDRIIPDHLKMRNAVSCWIVHHLTDKQKKNDSEFVVKISRNSETEHGDCVILLPVMRHGFTTVRLVGSQVIPLGSVKRNYQEPLFVGIKLNLKHSFVHSLNPLVLVLYTK